MERKFFQMVIKLFLNEDLPSEPKIGESDLCKESGIWTSRYSREQDP